MSGLPPFSAHKIDGFLLGMPSKRSLENLPFSLFAYFERSKSMDIYSISGQKGVRKTCIFLYIYAHYERSKSMDINSISGRKGCLKSMPFSVYSCSL